MKTADNKNEIKLMKTGCITLNGHEVGQWSKDKDLGYTAFLFNQSDRKEWSSNKRRLICRMYWLFRADIHWID